MFISYRRDDTSGQAGRLYDALAEHFGADNVFIDVDNIQIGMEFRDAIEVAVNRCDVLFALIGPRWLTVTDKRGGRRLDQEDDNVRLEIEAALERNIKVVPALLQGAVMPASEDLPEPLQPLTRRNAVEMSDGPRWRYDVSRLVSLLEQMRAGSTQPEVPPVDEATAAAIAAEAPPEPAKPTAPVEAPASRATDHVRDRHPESPAREPAAASARRAPVAHATGGEHGGGGAPLGGNGGGWEGGSAGSGGHGRGRGSGGMSDAPRWLVAMAGLGVVALVAVALFGAYQLGKGDDNATPAGSTTPGSTAPPGSTGPDTTPRVNYDPPANADKDQAALWLAIPKPIRGGSCALGQTEHAGGEATINCDYNDPKHGRTLVHLDRFIDVKHLNLVYAIHGPGQVVVHGGHPKPSGDVTVGGCTRSNWLGEGPWRHEMDSPTSPASGRYACFQDQGTCDLVAKMKLTDVTGTTCSVIVWTDYNARMFVKAEQPTAVHAGLSSFYDFWHHQFG